MCDPRDMIKQHSFRTTCSQSSSGHFAIHMRCQDAVVIRGKTNAKRAVSRELQSFDRIIIVSDGVLRPAKRDCLVLYDRLIV